MIGRYRSMDGNQYAHVYANISYFEKIYSIYSKRKAGDALKLFCQEFGVPEKVKFDGSALCSFSSVQDDNVVLLM